MSAIAGVCRFDAGPCDEARVGRMLDALAHRGDERARRGAPGASFGALAWHAAEPSAHTALHLAADGPRLVAFHGRLDNIDELREAIAARRPGEPPVTEAELVLGACDLWGADGPAHLLGDFAFAVWDAAARRLMLARDVFGVTPLFHRTDAATCSFASEPQPLCQDARGRTRPNAGMVAEHLAGIVTSRDETLVEGLRRLPPAHVLLADGRGVTTRRYWQPDPTRRVRYASDLDYERHLRELFAEAVRCRLRGAGRLGVLLSGGLDSSAIVGQVQMLAGSGAAQPRAVETFSLTCPGRPCDEAPFMHDVERMWGAPAHPCAERPLDWVAIAAADASRYADAPTYPNNSAADPLRALVAARGCRVVLSGLGGDEWLRGSPSYYADLLGGGHVGALVRRVGADARGPDFVGWQAAAKLAVWPLVPPRMQRIIKAVLAHDVTPPTVAPAFAAATGLRARLARLDRDLPAADITRREIFSEATSGEAVRALEQVDRSAGWFGFTERHPFLDRRLMAFAFAIPPEQHWRDGMPKSLMRRAFSDLLPPSVLARRGRPDYSHFVLDAVAAHGRAGLFDDLLTADLGWVEPRAVQRAYREACLTAGGQRAGRRWLWPLWAICAIEQWARAVLDPAGTGTFSRRGDGAAGPAGQPAAAVAR